MEMDDESDIADERSLFRIIDGQHQVMVNPGDFHITGMDGIDLVDHELPDDGAENLVTADRGLVVCRCIDRRPDREIFELDGNQADGRQCKNREQAQRQYPSHETHPPLLSFELRHAAILA